MPVDHLIAIGIGGSGAKCVEALMHLAVSGNAPANIYPIIIDQDPDNGNLERCKNVIKSYSDLRKNVGGQQKWFFKSTVEPQDKLLPLIPQDTKSNYLAAIGASLFTGETLEVVRSLYLPSQLKESLDLGYKKRAHMGSILFRKMIEIEESKRPIDYGLNYFIEKVRALPQPHVVVFGSLYGGAGASGMVEVGKYFREKLQNAVLKVVFLTPSFVVGKVPEGEDKKDANLVKSDADMQAVKIALEIYKDEIEKSFHHVYLVGSEVAHLQGEVPTTLGIFGGPSQKNPSHPFELIAASVAGIQVVQELPTKYHSFVGETVSYLPPVTFTLDARIPAKNNSTTIDLGINIIQFAIAKDFAKMLYDVRKNKEKWWERQPWHYLSHRTALVNWGVRHHSWCMEMSPVAWSSEGEAPHCWKKFSLEFEQQIQTYQFSAYLSKQIANRKLDDLSSIFYAIDELKSNKLEELQWAS